MTAGPGGVAPERWIAVCRRICDRVAAVLGELEPAERRRELGVGAGGDRTVVVDQRAEQIAIEELEALHREGGRFTLVSEEVGSVDFGGDGALVVLDPIDGSLNAKRGLPSFATSIAVADGPLMPDVAIGVVRDLGTGEEIVARRGEGAWVDGRAIPRLGPVARMELIALEGTRPSRVAAFAAALPGADRFRALGSLALCLTSVATARVDGMVGLRPGRAVDTAAGQLIAREAGAVVGMPGVEDLATTPLDVTTPRLLVAGGDRPTFEALLAALEASGL